MRTSDGGVPARDRRHAAVVALRRWWPYLLVLFVVLAGNALPLLGITHTDPLVTRSGLATITRPGFVGGDYTLDPNDGFTTLTLERRAALDLVHGHLPLWNRFEGVGTPLVGGAAAALWPFTLLSLVPNGLLLQHVLCELIAGFATVVLIRRLGPSSTAAALAGSVFALNGTFAWLANAAANPVCFLPLTLLGIEQVRAGRRRGPVVIAVGVAMSFLAGFPEIALIDLVLCAVWALARLPGTRVVPYALRSALGGGVGLLLAAPAVLPLSALLHISYVGPHTTAIAHKHLLRAGLSTIGSPYALGAPYQFYAADHRLLLEWGNFGGYVTAGVAVLAVVGLFSSRLPRVLRAALLAWVVVSFLHTFGGVDLVDTVFAHLPQLNKAAFYRYAPPSWELALAVLAAGGVDHLRTLAGRRAGIGVPLLVAGSGLALAAVFAVSRRARNVPFALLPKASIAAVVGVAVVLLLVALARGRIRRLLVPVAVAVVVAEAVGWFAVPTAVAPRAYHLDTAPATFQAAHGDGRAYPIVGPQPNFGSYFGFRQLNINDLPIPEAYRTLVQRELGLPALPPILPGGETETLAAAVRDREAAFEQVGVRYVWLPDEADLPADAVVVYRATGLVIGELPAARPLLDPVAGGPCQVDGVEDGTFRTRCAAAATIVDRQLALPGWTATVNGRRVPIGSDATGVFQTVAVPAGDATVVMRYWPPGFTAGLAAAAVGLVGLLGFVGYGLAPRLRRRRSLVDVADDEQQRGEDGRQVAESGAG